MNLPGKMPEYSIRRLDQEPFAVRCEELMGWMIIPRLGETSEWGLYDQPEGILTEYCELEVVGKASIHGVEGVEIHAKDVYVKDGGPKVSDHQFVAQLTDKYCRFLAHGWMIGDVHSFTTFLDEDFAGWSFGEDNCGKEVELSARGIITREGNDLTLNRRIGEYCIDLVGQYEVTIGGRTFDTVCMIDVETYDEGVLTEQFIDRSGHTVLWRRFNIYNWHSDRYGDWREKLPDAERLTVNGVEYVHWYDSVTDYLYGEKSETV